MNISTLIPVRNRIKFIARALNSVASQTFPSAEIIVVDGASTDGISDLVMSFSRQMTNINLITPQQNVGAAEATNIGMSHAKGDLIELAPVSLDTTLSNGTEKEWPS